MREAVLTKGARKEGTADVPDLLVSRVQYARAPPYNGIPDANLEAEGCLSDV